MTHSAILAPYEIREASDALYRSLDLQNDHTGETIATVRKLLDKRIPGCESNYLALKHDDASIAREMPDEELPEFAVRLLGTELFEGKFGQRMRSLILDKTFKKNPRIILQFANPNMVDTGRADEMLEKLLKDIREKRWISGSPGARKFVRIFGFPIKFAGMSSDKKPENVESVEKRACLGDLLPFQENLKSQMTALLEKDSGLENRGILQLPTGSGKTRIAVEAITEFWKTRAPETRFVIWIAQTEELCEQAFQSFKQIWEEQGTEGEILNLYRVWGSRRFPDEADEGIIIAGIHQLDELISASKVDGNGGNENELSRIRHLVGALIVDEAHGSTTAMYKRVYRSLEISVDPDDSKQIPLLGITATPYRSADYQTRLLQKQFNRNILFPNQKFDPKDGFDDRWRDYDFVLDRLTDDEVLSVPRYCYHRSGSVFPMDKTESEYLESKHMLPDALLDRVGKNTFRNLAVYKIIKKWADKKRSILFFGVNVNQAVMMKEFLNQNGIRSEAITSSTKYGSRHRYVEMFRKREIQVLCNYNVLTTGFDSPMVDTVIIARPTGSRLMYEQMVGRGLRGPKFGGTKECDIITVLDNILNYSRKRIKQGYEVFAEDVKGITSEERANLDKIKEGYEDAAESLEPPMPVMGEEFTDHEIRERFLVRTSEGIGFSSKHNFVVLVDSDPGNYKDAVDEESGRITCTGAGEEDQGFDAGVGRANAKVRDQKSVLLYFQKPEKDRIVFKHRAIYDSHSYSTARNRDGRKRRVIKFNLKIVKKTCPNCEETYASNDSEIEEMFGYRTIGNKRITQSWCKGCRRI